MISRRTMIAVIVVCLAVLLGLAVSDWLNLDLPQAEPGPVTWAGLGFWDRASVICGLGLLVSLGLLMAAAILPGCFRRDGDK